VDVRMSGRLSVAKVEGAVAGAKATYVLMLIQVLSRDYVQTRVLTVDSNTEGITCRVTERGLHNSTREALVFVTGQVVPDAEGKPVVDWLFEGPVWAYESVRGQYAFGIGGRSVRTTYCGSNGAESEVIAKAAWNRAEPTYPRVEITSVEVYACNHGMTPDEARKQLDDAILDGAICIGGLVDDPLERATSEAEGFIGYQYRNATGRLEGTVSVMCQNVGGTFYCSQPKDTLLARICPREGHYDMVTAAKIVEKVNYAKEVEARIHRPRRRRRTTKQVAEVA